MLVGAMSHEPLRTYCRVCEAACGLVAERDDLGRVIGLRPDRDHPVSRGYACAKGTRFLEVARDPARLLRPRVDGHEVDWDRANAASGQRLRAIVERHGPHAIGLYFGNPMAFDSLGLAATFAFTRWLGTRNVFSASSQDCNNKFAGASIVHGSPAVHPVPDFEHADLAVVFGSNPYVSQSSFVHLGGGATVFDRLIARGGDVVWIDPRRSESARRWGRHLALRPGTDLWLVLALLALLGERAPTGAGIEGFAELLAAARSIDLAETSARTGIAIADIHDLADRIARARATAFHMSVGANQGGFGTMTYVALQALIWATGNLDRRGGSQIHPLASAFARVSALLRPDAPVRSRVGDFAAVIGTLPGGILADEILVPGPERVRALIVLAGDPLRSIPGEQRLRRAFSELELLVSIDLFANQTAELAHVVLPATSWLERWDVALSTSVFHTGSLLQMAGPVIDAVGEARSDARIVADLAIAMGARNPLWKLPRLPLERWLPRPRHGLRGPAARSDRPRRRRMRFWDPSFPAELARLRAQDPSDGYTLVCRRRRLGHNSWLHGGARRSDNESVAWLGPDDMRALGLRDGDLIDIASTTASLRIPVRTAEGLAARTVVVPHGLREHNINAIIPSGVDRIERISGQHMMTGIPVTVTHAS